MKLLVCAWTDDFPRGMLPAEVGAWISFGRVTCSGETLETINGMAVKEFWEERSARSNSRP